MGKRILVIGTLDTKAVEVIYIKGELEAKGHKAVLMDVGVMGEAPIVPAITKYMVASRGGVLLEEMRAWGSEDRTMRQMAIGAAKIAEELCAQNEIDAALAIGGTMGTDLALDVMGALPLGFPKLIVSSVAFSHIIPPERICADLMMILWAGGLWGLNSACKMVLNNACAAICGAAEAYKGQRIEKPMVAVTSLGHTCLKYLNWLKPALEERGYEVVVFHTVGMGGRALEFLLSQGKICAVFDLSLIEVSDHALGSVVSAGENRLETAGLMGIPQIVAPGCIGGFDIATWQPLHPRLKGRAVHYHNRLISAVLNTAEEKATVAKVIAEKLNKAVGPTAMIIPLKGFEEWDKAGSELYDPEGIAAFAEAFKKNVDNECVQTIEVDAHINDEAFAQEAMNVFDRMLSKPEGDILNKRPQKVMC